MKKLTTIEEIKALEQKKVVELFNNFSVILNGHSDDEMLQECANCKPYNLYLANYYSPKDDASIYDMGNGYYMLVNQQLYHKGVNAMLVNENVEKPKSDFEHTTQIVRVIE